MVLHEHLTCLFTTSASDLCSSGGPLANASNPVPIEGTAPPFKPDQDAFSTWLCRSTAELLRYPLSL
jgi:hypothetical protein